MPPDLRLEVSQVAAILSAQFPELRPTVVRVIGEGCDNQAFEVNQEWIFRFPKRAEVERQLGIETRVLAILAESSLVPVPVFLFAGRPTREYPARFAGYRKLPGIPAIQLDESALPLTTWAPAVGRFLSWLHRFPLTDVVVPDIPRRDVVELTDEMRGDALASFPQLDQVIARPPRAWRRYLAEASPGPVRSAPVLVHHDFAAEHVLGDPGRQLVTGVIDWSAVAVSDRSVDLGGLFHWSGQPAVDAALACYQDPVDQATIERARFLAVCRAVEDVAFGLETGRREYCDAGVRALELCLGRG